MIQFTSIKPECVEKGLRQAISLLQSFPGCATIFGWSTRSTLHGDANASRKYNVGTVRQDEWLSRASSCAGTLASLRSRA
jgi:hypothetical protein